MMTRCKSKIMHILLGLFMLTLISVIAPQQALAFDLVVENTNSKTLSFAVKKFIDQDNAWQVVGWWNVAPNSNRTLHFNTSNSKDYFYIWGHAGEITFDGGKDSDYRPIISNKFDYWDTEGMENGENMRWVSFSRLKIEGGKAYWCPGEKAVVSSGTDSISSQLGPKIVDIVLQLKGKPYVWGGSSPETGFDCSGLTYYVLGQLGVNIERTADVQYHRQESISFKDLQPGDLVFFSFDKNDPDPQHVGIFIGNGQFIHAENTQGAGPGATGMVNVASFDRWYQKNFVGGRRFY